MQKNINLLYGWIKEMMAYLVNMHELRRLFNKSNNLCFNSSKLRKGQVRISCSLIVVSDHVGLTKY